MSDSTGRTVLQDVYQMWRRLFAAVEGNRVRELLLVLVK